MAIRSGGGRKLSFDILRSSSSFEIDDDSRLYYKSKSDIPPLLSDADSPKPNRRKRKKNKNKRNKQNIEFHPNGISEFHCKPGVIDTVIYKQEITSTTNGQNHYGGELRQRMMIPEEEEENKELESLAKQSAENLNVNGKLETQESLDWERVMEDHTNCECVCVCLF